MFSSTSTGSNSRLSDSSADTDDKQDEVTHNFFTVVSWLVTASISSADLLLELAGVNEQN